MKTLATVVTPSLLRNQPPLGARRVVFKNFAEEAGHLRKMVTEGTADMSLRELTISIIRPRAEAKHEADQALAVAEWVQDNIYYVHEGTETFEKPATTLRLRAGDCDAMTVLILSMLGTIGIRGKMCILKINGRYAHIFPIAIVKQDGEMHRLTLDATLNKPVRDLVNPVAMAKSRGDKVEALFA